jgi:hypothetical protein
MSAVENLLKAPMNIHTFLDRLGMKLLSSPEVSIEDLLQNNNRGNQLCWKVKLTHAF